ncbi:MAG: hypothetical protein V4489_03835 [Chlamydiota bacterium]
MTIFYITATNTDSNSQSQKSLFEFLPLKKLDEKITRAKAHVDLLQDSASHTKSGSAGRAKKSRLVQQITSHTARIETLERSKVKKCDKKVQFSGNNTFEFLKYNNILYKKDDLINVLWSSQEEEEKFKTTAWTEGALVSGVDLKNKPEDFNLIWRIISLTDFLNE